MFWMVSLSPRIRNEKKAGKMGMKLVKTFALVMPRFLTENAKRIKAPHDAKTASSIIGMKSFRVRAVPVR
jgi:hypothetical protein